MYFDTIEDRDILESYYKRRDEVKDMDFSTYCQTIAIFTSTGIAYAFRLDDNTVLGLGGVIKTHQGTGQIWFMLSDEVSKHAYALTKLCKDLLQKLLESGVFHRIQIQVSTQHPTWIRWVKMIGFEEEGLMKQYFPNKEDAILLSVVSNV